MKPLGGGYKEQVDAKDITVETRGFSDNLSAYHKDLQKVADAVDTLAVGMTTEEKAAYLKLVQDPLNPQTVTGDAPIFNAGTKNNDDVIILAGKKLVLDGA